MPGGAWRAAPARFLTGLAVVAGIAGCSPSGAPAQTVAPVSLATAPPGAAVEQRTPPARANALFHATPAQVVAALGKPDLRRVDGSAEVWMYHTAKGCRLDLVFYRGPTGLRVAAASAHSPPRTSEAACLKALAATH